LADWRRFTKLPQNYGCRDFRIAERAGKVVGLAESSLRNQGLSQVRFSKLVVDPAARRRRIGTMLLKALLSIADQPQDVSYQMLVSPEWTSGMAFASAFGFVHIESEITMGCTQLLPPKVDLASSNILIEAVSNVADHASEIARIHNAAYASDAAFRPLTPQEVVESLEGAELWMAFKDRGAVGFCHLEPEADMIWLESIAVDPNIQSRGIGLLLAYHALAANNVRTDVPAGLNVSSKNRSALKLYQRIGFVPRRERWRFSAERRDLLERIR
jgi:N-acetylglutamate synthase-like GNAT family acetyltransferase